MKKKREYKSYWMWSLMWNLNYWWDHYGWIIMLPFILIVIIGEIVVSLLLRLGQFILGLILAGGIMAGIAHLIMWLS
ncbi:hypothetical protein [Mesomycoplasma ovipneumoniae]